MNEANCFAKGASELRIADASQLQKKAVVNQKTIKLAQRISITEQKTNNSPIRKDRQIRIAAREASKYRKPDNKQITIAKHKTNLTLHHRMAKHEQPITIAKAIQQSYQKGSANNHRSASNAKHKANANCNLCKTNAEQKAKHNRKTKVKLQSPIKTRHNWDQESRNIKYCK